MDRTRKPNKKPEDDRWTRDPQFGGRWGYPPTPPALQTPPRRENSQDCVVLVRCNTIPAAKERPNAQIPPPSKKKP